MFGFGTQDHLKCLDLEPKMLKSFRIQNAVSVTIVAKTACDMIRIPQGPMDEAEENELYDRLLPKPGCKEIGSRQLFLIT